MQNDRDCPCLHIRPAYPEQTTPYKGFNIPLRGYTSLAMGVFIPIVLIAEALAGVVVLVCGNYLPKCKRNYTIGIKLPWTLDNEDNWNKTHRFAGFVWVIGGIVITLDAFLSISLFIILDVIVLLIILPVVYSYLLYQKQMKDMK